MVCKNCGKENSEGSKFCKGCGKPLEESVSSVAESAVENSQSVVKTAGEEVVNSVDQAAGSVKQAVNSATQTANSAKQAVNSAAQTVAGERKSGPGQTVNSGVKGGASQNLEKNKAASQKTLLAVAVGAVLVVLVAVLYLVVSNASKTINLNKYLTISTEGYEGYGTATAYIDWDAIEKKYGSKLKYTNAGMKDYGYFSDMINPIDFLQEDVNIQLDKTGDLSNGDTIAYTWKVDNDLSRFINCKLKFKDGEHKVSDLEKIGTFNAFEDLDVEFNGIAPDGMASINYNGDIMQASDFRCDKYDGLSNGDVVTVSIDKNNVSRYAQAIGKVPAELQKKFTVEGLEQYVTKISEIDNDSLEAMKAQASDELQSHIAKKWDDTTESLVALNYQGNYLLIAKKKDTWDGKNYLFLVYQMQVRTHFSGTEGSYDQMHNIYWYIRYQDLILGKDGKVSVDLASYYTPNVRYEVDSGVSDGWYSTHSWYYNGYESIDKLYKDVVTSNLSEYNHEDNVAQAG